MSAMCKEILKRTRPASVIMMSMIFAATLAACLDGVTTGAAACEGCAITLTLSQSESVRTDQTRDLWRTQAQVSFSSSILLPPGLQSAEVVSGQAGGRDILVGLMHPQTVIHEEMPGEYEEDGPEPGSTHYLFVQLGSSAGTGNSPHPHVNWTDNGSSESIDPEEEEAAEEDFFGLALFYTGGDVEITIDGTPYAGALEVDGEVLEAVETGEGLRYAVNVDVPDGTYDITIVVRAAPVTRLEDAGDKWQSDTTFTFIAVDISTDGADVLGRPIREIDAGAGAEFVVLDGWTGLGAEVGHTPPDLHTGFMENTMGDSSQMLEDGTNELVAGIEENATARNLYDEQGLLISPDAADSDPLYFQVTLLDPNAALDHDEENLLAMPNSEAEVEIEDAEGNALTIHEDDLIPTYSHELGFHYGANVRFPPTEGGSGGDDGGGHGH